MTCSRCGKPIEGKHHDCTASSMATVAMGSAAAATSSAFDEGRFPPGTLLAGRYRIVSMLGRGAMVTAVGASTGVRLVALFSFSRGATAVFVLAAAAWAFYTTRTGRAH
jgi:hypothetical protein